jgi:hypothetical protein
MIENQFHTKKTHEIVKEMSGGAFEERIHIPGAPDSVNYIRALAGVFKHGLDGLDVILQIGVNGHYKIALSGFQTGQQGILVPAISGKPKTPYQRGPFFMAFRGPADEFPGLIPAAVIDDQYFTSRTYQALSQTITQQIRQNFDSAGDDAFFVIAGNHQTDFHVEAPRSIIPLVAWT